MAAEQERKEQRKRGGPGHHGADRRLAASRRERQHGDSQDPPCLQPGAETDEQSGPVDVPAPGVGRRENPDQREHGVGGMPGRVADAGQARRHRKQPRSSVQNGVRDSNRPNSCDHEERGRRREHERERIARAAERTEERELQRPRLDDRV